MRGLVIWVASLALAVPASAGIHAGGEGSTARGGAAASSASFNGGPILSPPPAPNATATAQPGAGDTQPGRPSASSVLALPILALGYPVPLLALGMGIAGLALWRTAMRD